MDITETTITSFIATTVALVVTMWRENVREKQQQVAYLHSILAEVNSLIALISVRKDGILSNLVVTALPFVWLLLSRFCG